MKKIPCEGRYYMRQTLNRISRRMSAIFSILFGAAKQQADHQKLARYIVAINSRKTIEKIMAEAACCLKEIMGYRLFGFVMKNEDKVDIWLDPGVYKAALEQIVQNDFHLRNQQNLNFLNHNFLPEDPQIQLNLDNLVFYEFEQENVYSRIYMLPQENTVSTHGEIVSMILQSCATAINRLEKIENLTNAAVIDSLTGCYNRREFENQLKRNVAGAARYKSDLSVFIFDLDHFKTINDTFGHPAGDKVLQEVAALVSKNMRTGDILARYGGEEFIAILPETDKIKAMELADRLRRKIERNPVAWESKAIRVTASFGVAQLDPRAGMERIIQDADTMLYKAKINGRNTVMPGLIKVVPARIKKFK